MFGWTRPDHRDVYAFVSEQEIEALNGINLEGPLLDPSSPENNLTLFLDVREIRGDIEKKFSGDSCQMSISRKGYHKLVGEGRIATRDVLDDHLAVLSEVAAQHDCFYGGYLELARKGLKNK